MALSESIADITAPDDVQDKRPRNNVQGVKEHMDKRTRMRERERERERDIYTIHAA